MAYENELAIAQKAVMAAAQLCETVRRDMVPEAMEKQDKSPSHCCRLRLSSHYL
jgi:3'(2'), 5'-bisphosphate nucleotidase